MTPLQTALAEPETLEAAVLTAATNGGRQHYWNASEPQQIAGHAAYLLGLQVPLLCNDSKKRPLELLRNAIADRLGRAPEPAADKTMPGNPREIIAAAEPCAYVATAIRAATTG